LQDLSAHAAWMQIHGADPDVPPAIFGRIQRCSAVAQRHLCDHCGPGGVLGLPQTAQGPLGKFAGACISKVPTASRITRVAICTGAPCLPFVR
jgi:hypothetical protein